MKDLKHLYAMEKLLQSANNDLVRQAVDAGQYALGYNCYYIPEVLLNLGGCFSVRLRAPDSATPDVASYYLTNRNCSYTRCILERAIEGGFHFLSALFGSETCAAMERAEEHFTLLHPIENPRFFATILDAPMKDDRTSIAFYKSQLVAKVLEPLSEKLGVDVSDAAIGEAVAAHNEICRLVTAIGEYRKAERPVITGYEFHVVQLVSQCCPQRLVKPMLEDILAELKTREPDAKSAYRVRVVLAGSEIDDPAFTKLIESCGALVVADRYCFGSFPSREEIVIREGETALDAVARHYLETSECPRFMSRNKVAQRHAGIKRLADEFHADGVVFEAMKFCEFWGYEKVLASHVLQNEMGVPCCSVEKEYTLNNMGQLRTRFQAFVESLELKKLGKEGTEASK